MDRKVKVIAIAAIAALIVVSAIIVLYPRGSEEPIVLEARVTGLDSFGNYALDVTEEQLHELGADAGYDLYLDIDGERLTAMHCHEWNGVPYGAIFLNYNASANEISLGMYNAYIREEVPLKGGDELGISLKGPNKYYDSLDRYLQPFSGNTDDYASEEIFANFRELTGASLKEDLIYRSASPWTTKDDRTYYVNKLCGEEGIDSLILLDIYQGDLEDVVQPFKDLYCYGLYASGHVQANKFHPAVLSSKDDLRKLFEMLDGAEGKVCIACKLGKDRTGTFCAMLQALAGASYEEICDEFMVSITNYYGIEKGTEEYETVENIYIHPMMYSIKHPEIIGNYHEIDWETIDFEPFDPYDAVYSFLSSYAGIDSALIDKVIDKITARWRRKTLRRAGTGACSPASLLLILVETFVEHGDLQPAVGHHDAGIIERLVHGHAEDGGDPITGSFIVPDLSDESPFIRCRTICPLRVMPRAIIVGRTKRPLWSRSDAHRDPGRLPAKGAVSQSAFSA